MNKCRNCGVFVPIEKAFCPNCSEPIEPEEAPDRSTTSSRDMMSTLRDDPEHYKDLLQELTRKKSSAPPTAAAAQTLKADTARSAPAPPQPIQTAGYSAPQAAMPLPPARSNNRSIFLLIAIISVLVLLFVIFMVFRPF